MNRCRYSVYSDCNIERPQKQMKPWQGSPTDHHAITHVISDLKRKQCCIMGSLCLQALWCNCSVSSEVTNTEVRTETRFFHSLSYIHTLTSQLSLFQDQTNKAKQFHPQFSDIPWKQQHFQIRSVRNSITVSQKANNHPSVAFPSYHHLNLSTSPPPLTFTPSLHLSHTDSWDSLTVFVCVWAHARKAPHNRCFKQS